jgi:hypothetical protein
VELDTAPDHLEAATSLGFPLLRLSAYRAVRSNDHAHRAPLLKVLREKTSAADDLVVGMRCQHEKAFAAK